MKLDTRSLTDTADHIDVDKHFRTKLTRPATFLEEDTTAGVFLHPLSTVSVLLNLQIGF